MKNYITKFISRCINFFTPVETIRESKKKWSALARKNAPYYIWSEKEKPTEDEFRASGQNDYEHYVKNDPLLQRVLTLIHAKKILEIGCGIGRMTEYFGNDFETIYGVDIAPEMIQKARIRLPDGKFIFLEGNGTHLPVTSESIDFVFSFIVFQHMPTTNVVEENFLETYRILKHGGVFKVQLRGNAVRKNEWFYGVNFSPREASLVSLRSGFEILSMYSETERYLWLLLKKP